MLKLMVAVVAIALPDCINPTLIGGELLVATRPRPRWSTLVFTLAAWTVTFAFGLAFALGLGDLILSLVPTLGRSVKYAMITAAGALLLVGGLGIWIKRRELVTSEATHKARESHGSSAVIGAGMAGLELLTAFPYFAAIAMIVGSGVSNAGKVWLIALYCLVYTLPLVLIAVVVAVMGDRAEAILEPIGDWLFDHWPTIVGPLTAAIGVGVLVLGVVNLTG